MPPKSVNRVLWRASLFAADVLCYLVHAEGQFALRVEHGNECVLAEMMPDEATGLRRAEEVRQSLERRVRQ